MRFDRKSLLVFFAILSLTLAASAQRRQRTITIPAGTRITVRMIDSLSSDTAQQGQEFHGSLEYPISVDGRDVIPRGADVVGRVTDAHVGGRLSDPGYVTLELVSVGSGSQTTAVQTEAYQIKGESHTKSNVTKIGGGAALGAIIGGIAGGGRGAAIGAGAGAAAGTGVAVATARPVPAAAPAPAPMAAPLPPPAMPPMIAPSAAPPPIFVTLLLVCDSPLIW